MDSLLVVLLDKSQSMTDGGQTQEYKNWVNSRRSPRTAAEKAAAKLEEAHIMKGAVYSLRAKATMESFNHFLQVMKYRRDACDLYMVQFAGRNMVYDPTAPKGRRPSGPLDYKVTHDFVDLFEAAPLNPDTYVPDGGGTAIYDAIQQAMDAVRDKLQTLPQNEHPTQVTMLIQTDGEDNTSMRGYQECLDRMAYMRTQGWNFVFIGTGREGVSTGKDMGFVAGKNLLEYDGNGAGGMEAFTKAAQAVLESLITGNMEV